MSCHVLPVLSASQCKKSSDVGNILQALEQRDEVQEVVVRRVVDPALYWDGVICWLAVQHVSNGTLVRGQRHGDRETTPTESALPWWNM